MKNFTNLYPLSKTLRFELIPKGETLHNIEKHGLLTEDINRANDYKEVKRIIDDYHKAFMNEALEGLNLSDLYDYYSLYQIAIRDENQKKEFEKSQTSLRKQIALRFAKHPNKQIQTKFKNLFNKELIKSDLPAFLTKQLEKDVVAKFDQFTTYFTGFHENRKNMYSAEDKSTAIGFRLIHQNLPKFIDNMKTFQSIKASPIAESLGTIQQKLEPILQTDNISEFFELQGFNETLTQLGIDRYNALLGGYVSEDGKTKLQGLNEYINLHNQQVKDRSQKIGKLKPLYKQILSDRNSASFLPDEFKNDIDLLESVGAYHTELLPILMQVSDFLSFEAICNNIEEYDLNHIYIKNDLGLTQISQKLYGNWGIIQEALNLDYSLNYAGKAKPETEKYKDERTKHFKKIESFSIAELNKALKLLNQEETDVEVQTYFANLGRVRDNESWKEQLINAYATVEDLLNTDYPADGNLASDKASVAQLKIFLDSLKTIQNFVKPILGSGTEPNKDEKFYGDILPIANQLDLLTPLYNMVRNYVTRKPYSTEKIKLNFENSTLLNGWDVNKEKDNTSLLFEKEGMFYLGIMKKEHNKLFEKMPKAKSANCFNKVNYKLLPGANQNLPRVFFSAKNIEFYNPSDTIIEIRNTGSHTKNGSPQTDFEKQPFNLGDCRKMIDFFKDSLAKHPDWKKFNFEFQPTATYNSIDEFYREVENQGYQLTYTAIDEEYILDAVKEEKLYLFQIYNKDFSPHSKGTPNMHTLYWKMLFDEKNLANVVYKLNGEAEVFYRKRSIKKANTIIHAANEVIQNKNDQNDKKTSTFKYDIIKDRRFTVDKFQFHVPITLNFKARGLNNINATINEAIQAGEIKHIIGLDRGERHLLYLSLINMKGEIVQQFSLNEIVNEYKKNTYKTNYHSLLNEREGSRDDARKSWKTIETIKELKEGYLSQVIHKIAQLIVEYNAIVVLEDLNMGFMRGRQKVEKQVYQKFEKMLIDKLNYLVFKNNASEQLAGTLNALQLTNKFESFKKMGKQSGVLFYVPAWNTSKMDPTTGFVNLLYPKYEKIDKSKAFFAKFDDIRFNSKQNYFEFLLNYKNFTTKAEGTQTKWTVCTYGKRIKTYRNAKKNNQWDNEEIVLTDAFVALFNEYGIDLNANGLKNSILEQSEKAFFDQLTYLLKLTLQMRNSITNTEIDYLISPVAKNGVFFDSSKAREGLPKDADANGAYNIARKGLWVVQQIEEAPDLKKLKLAISNKEWLSFVQNN